VIDLDRLEAKALAATPGPWRLGRYPQEMTGPDQVVIDTDIGPKVLLAGNINFYDSAKADAAFAAEANPAAILELVAELKMLRLAHKTESGEDYKG
jgi:hypothetical protein